MNNKNKNLSIYYIFNNVFDKKFKMIFGDYISFLQLFLVVQKIHFKFQTIYRIKFVIITIYKIARLFQ